MSVDADVQRDAGVAGGGPFDLDPPVRRRSLGGATLSAFTGRKPVEDARSLPQRRASALVELAGAKLDEGGLGKGARIRPHILVHVPIETLRGLESGAPRPGAEGVQGRSGAGDGGVGEECGGSSQGGEARLSKAKTRRKRGRSIQLERRDDVGCLGGSMP